MCGRYTLHQNAASLVEHYQLRDGLSSFNKNYNVAPGQQMPVITSAADGNWQLQFMSWGLTPAWSKGPTLNYRLINTRDDHIFTRPTWRRLVFKQRALIPADGFYEWDKIISNGGQPPKKQPYYIHLKNNGLFSFAGLWESWQNAEGKELKSYSIITTAPNKQIARIHERMPVMLHQEEEAAWLEPSLISRESLEPLLRPYEDDLLEMYEVSEAVNSPKNNDERLIYALD